MRVLVCGGRDYDNRELVFAFLEMLHPSVIIQGEASGADKLAKEWAMLHDIRHLDFEADWLKYRRGAGPIRNKKMIVEGKPDIVVAFPGGRGTANMMKQAIATKIPCVNVGYLENVISGKA